MTISWPYTMRCASGLWSSGSPLGWAYVGDGRPGYRTRRIHQDDATQHSASSSRGTRALPHQTSMRALPHQTGMRALPHETTDAALATVPSRVGTRLRCQASQLGDGVTFPSEEQWG